MVSRSEDSDLLLRTPTYLTDDPQIDDDQAIDLAHKNFAPGAQTETWAVASLLLQHISSCFGFAAYEFSSYVFLIEIYRDTLAPASLVGFIMMAVGIVFSTQVGSLVDRMPRLRFVRSAIIFLKAFQVLNWSIHFILLKRYPEIASAAFHLRAPLQDIIIVWGLLISQIVFACLLHLSQVGMDVAIERDWVTAIAQGDSIVLSQLNSYMRMIDLVSKLLGPMIVSLFTLTFTYPQTAMILIGLAGIQCIAEFSWIQVVYSRFPILKIDQDRRQKHITEQYGHDHSQGIHNNWIGLHVTNEWKVWKGFARMPVFLTSLAYALTWLTTLSFDGIGVSYFKVAKGYSGGFLAMIRMACIATSVIGTVASPWSSRVMGFQKAGALTIWIMSACLVPPLVTFFSDNPGLPLQVSTYNPPIMFGGIILSRAFAVSFDLVQTKIIQESLEYHPQRNRLSALQNSLTSLCALLRYAMTFILSSPDQFRWTALVSVLANMGAGVLFMLYIAETRNKAITV